MIIVVVVTAVIAVFLQDHILNLIGFIVVVIDNVFVIIFINNATTIIVIILGNVVFSAFSLPADVLIREV